jgi:GTPase SAR1 family protein
VQDLVSLEDVMQEFKLGPNGSMIYCMEFLEANIDWLAEKIKQHNFDTGCKYFIFDLPGQVEIYSNHNSLKNVLKALSSRLHFTFSALHLVDVSYLYDKHRFLSALALSLTAIIGMEMPFINAITKVDLLGKLGRPDMNLTFYNEISGLKYLFYEC